MATRGIILLNGRIGDYGFYRAFVRDGHGDLVVAADGGANHAKAMMIVPDVIVGDMDSIDASTLTHFRKLRVKIVKYPTEKDETDAEIAFDYAMEHGADEVVFMGALGKRPDHLIANLSLLAKAVEMGAVARIVEDGTEVHVVDSVLSLDGAPGDTVSLIPFGGHVTGVTLTGFKYALSDGVLEMGSTLGMSNVLAVHLGTVVVESGLLAVFHFAARAAS